MDTIDFKGLWSKQPTSEPNLAEMRKLLSTYKRKNMRKIILINICLLATIAYIIWVWAYFQPEFFTTKLGIVIVILSIGMSLFYQNKTIPLYKEIEADQPTQDYLKKLLELKAKQRFIQTKVLSLYFILLGVGLALYMIEYTSRMTLLWASVTYGVTLAWIAFVWFFMRPRKIKKENQKLDDIISRFNHVSQQLVD